MDDFDIIQLPTEKIVVFIISTTGQGQPTATMKKSWTFLTRKDLPADSLSQLNFSVFGLGDSSYEIFNAMARKLYQRLLQLGAKSFHERALGDDQHDFGYEAEFDPWLKSLFEDLFQLDPSIKSTEIEPEAYIEDSVYTVDIITESQRETNLSEEERKFLEENTENGNLNTLNYFNNPLNMKSGKLFGEVKVNQRITSDEIKESDDKETKHVELEFGEQELSYVAGDVCSIIPQNSTTEIANFLKSQNLNDNDLLRIRKN